MQFCNTRTLQTYIYQKCTTLAGDIHHCECSRSDLRQSSAEQHGDSPQVSSEYWFINILKLGKPSHGFFFFERIILSLRSRYLESCKLSPSEVGMIICIGKLSSLFGWDNLKTIPGGGNLFRCHVARIINTIVNYIVPRLCLVIMAASLLVTGVAGQLVRNREYRRNANNCIHRGGMCLTRNRVNNCHRTKIFYKSEKYLCIDSGPRGARRGGGQARAADPVQALLLLLRAWRSPVLGA